MPPGEPAADDGLDTLDAMASRSRRHRSVPPPKKAGLSPQRAQKPPAAPTEGREGPEHAGGADSAAEPVDTAEAAIAETQTAEPSPPANLPPGRPGARARSRRNTGDRITWTPEAKALRSALTSYQAQLRKLAERQREVRKLARKVNADDVTVIVQRVAQDTSADRAQLGDAAGLADPD